MTDLDDFKYTDGLDDVLAVYVNRLQAATLRGEYRNVETISSTKALTDNDCPIQVLTPTGENRDVVLATVAANNHPYFIINPAGSSFSLVVKSGATTLATVAAGGNAHLVSDGTIWRVASVRHDIDYGWIPVSDVWTRTGNHTFTVAGDLTSKYRKGTFVRYKDGGGFEYGVVAASAYGAPNTTVTLIPNSSYEMAAATITDTWVSYIRDPEGFPDAFAYSVVWSTTADAPSIGDGELLGYWYPVSNSLIMAKVHLAGGSTTNFGTGLWNFGIPIAPKILAGGVAIESAAGNLLHSSVRYAINAFVRSADMRGIYQNNIMGQGTPVTMVSGSRLNLSCLYGY